MDKNGKYRRFRSHSLRKLFSTTCRRNITQVVVNSDKTSEIDIISIFTGHVPTNESNSKVYVSVESDSHESYLRKVYIALSPYLSIKEIEIKDIKTQQYKDLEEQNKVLKQQLEAQAVSMQREMDEQKERLKKFHNKDLKEKYSKKKHLKLRILKITLENGIMKYLLTNILDKNFTIEDFKELYNLRWGIETNYNTMKN